MHRLADLLTLFVFCVFSASQVCAQFYSVAHFNEKNGFKSNTVYKINQDGLGYIWISTNVGLLRYDGITFKEYSLEDGLVDLYILDILIDSDDHVLHPNLSNRLNFYFHDHFYSTQNDTSLSEIAFNDRPVVHFYTKENAFLLSSTNSFYFFYLQLVNGKVLYKKKISLRSNATIQSITSVGDFYYVLYTLGSSTTIFYSVYKKTLLINEGRLDGNVIPSSIVPYDKYFCFIEENKQHILFYRFTPDHHINYIHSVETPFSIKNLITSRGTLWCTTIEGGIYQMDSTRILNSLFPDHAINNILLDREDNIWIGTEDNGLYHLRNHPIRNLDIEDLKFSKGVMSLSKGEDSKVFLGLNKSAIAVVKGGSVISVNSLDKEHAPASRRVMKMVHLGGDTLLCGTDDHFSKIAFDFRQVNNQITTILSAPDAVKDIDILSASVYYVGTSHTLFKVDQKFHFHEILSERTISLHIDEDHWLWIGTLYGLYIKKDSISEPETYASNLLSDTRINDIASKGETVFLATDAGVCILSKDADHPSRFIQKRDGLSNNCCLKLVYEEGILWVATSEGIAKIKFDSAGSVFQSIDIIDKSDGLISNYINDILVDKDTVWAATTEGLSIFSIESIHPQPRSQVTIIEAKTNLKEHNVDEPIDIKSNENNISISFSTMSFDHNTNQLYEYRLIPIEQNWYQTLENRITFSNLSPNQYNFQVRAVANGPTDAVPLAQLSFCVLPSFVQTILFKSIVCALIAGFLLLIFNIRISTIKKQNYFKRTSALLELEAIKAQINPHFIYNSLNSIKGTIVKKNHKEAEKQLTTFAQLVRRTLNISRMNFVSLGEEIEYLTSYLEMEKIRFKKKLQFSISVDNIADLHMHQIPSMLIQPYVENAVKHGTPDNEHLPNMVSINFAMVQDQIVCTVEDNGPGIKKTVGHKVKHHPPEGMRISSSRAKKYNVLFSTNIKVIAKDRPSGGTSVTIRIPNNLPKS